MSYEIIATSGFKKEIKKNSKKHSSLKKDFSELVDQLTLNPTRGTPIGHDCFKIRRAFSPS